MESNQAHLKRLGGNEVERHALWLFEHGMSLDRVARRMGWSVPRTRALLADVCRLVIGGYWVGAVPVPHARATTKRATAPRGRAWPKTCVQRQS